jgi:RND family efflux transporter MFP subunit
MTLLQRAAACVLALGVLAAAPARGQTGGWITGITEAINDVTLSAPAAGIIGKRPLKEGDFVKAGGVILELDKKLEELEVNRRKAVLDMRRTELESAKKLFEKTISLSREEMDKKVTEFAVAEAEYDLAREQLNRRHIYAPFDGTVAALIVEVGETCQAQQALARLVDTRHCYFICNIEARAGYSLKTGQAVKLEIEAGDKPAEFTGSVFFVSPVVDPASGLMRVKVIFENPDGRIRPGVAGRMLLQENKDA